jgi:hypothetical protein
MLFVMWKHDDDEEYVCCRLPGDVFTMVYIIWLVFSIVGLIFIILFRLNKLSLPGGNEANTAGRIFGTNSRILDPRIFVLGFVYLAVQVITMVVACVAHRSIKQEEVEFKGFA